MWEWTGQGHVLLKITNSILMTQSTYELLMLLIVAVIVVVVVWFNSFNYYLCSYIVYNVQCMHDDESKQTISQCLRRWASDRFPTDDSVFSTIEYSNDDCGHVHIDSQMKCIPLQNETYTLMHVLSYWHRRQQLHRLPYIRTRYDANFIK